MKKALLFTACAVLLVLAGFVAGLYALRGSVAYEALAIKSIYDPMEDTALFTTTDLSVTSYLAEQVVKGNLKEYYRVACLRVSLSLDALQDLPPEYAKKFRGPEAVAKAKAMLKDLQSRGYCKPTPASRRVLNGI